MGDYKLEHKVHITESAKELEAFLDNFGDEDGRSYYTVYPQLTGLLNVKAIIIVTTEYYIEEPVKQHMGYNCVPCAPDSDNE